MSDAPYQGFSTIDQTSADALENDKVETYLQVLVAQRFMTAEVPLMAVAAGLLPNPHRTVDSETIEEGLGELAHRIQISRQLRASFVVFPDTLSGTRAQDFLNWVTPEYDHLVIAASEYRDDARNALAAHWPGSITLLTFAGTESNHQYEIYTD